VANDEMQHFPGNYPTHGVTFGMAGAIHGDRDTAVSFDGTTGITMPLGLDFLGTDAFSLELWANQSRYSAFGWTLDHGDYSDAGHGRNGWDLLLGSDSVLFERWDLGTGGSVGASPGPLSLGVYHHVVATFDGNEHVLYIDGEVVDAGTAPASIPDSGRVTWTIGHQNCGCSGGYVGVLDEVAVYATALTSARVQAHYAAAKR
jgi:hypothetical protein